MQISFIKIFFIHQTNSFIKQIKLCPKKMYWNQIKRSNEKDVCASHVTNSYLSGEHARANVCLVCLFKVFLWLPHYFLRGALINCSHKKGAFWVNQIKTGIKHVGEGISVISTLCDTVFSVVFVSTFQS